MTISTIGNNGLALTSPLPVLQGGTGVTTSTGTGNNVLSISPTLVTPNIGAATATSITGMSTPLSIAQGGTGFVDGTPMFRNRIINGGMVIDQRNAGASVTPTNTQYTLDRYWAWMSQPSKFTVQQNAGAVTPPVGFANYLGATSLSAYSILTTDYFSLVQNIEAINFCDFGWGTASASTITLSFRVYSSLTGTFGGALANNAQTRSYPFTYSIPVANTWTTISITIAGDTTGTWLGATNGIGVRVQFGLGVGSSNTTTAGAWYGANYISATGATSVVGTSGATFYITGVQLEKGSVATSFDYRPYGTELSLCQRYYINASYPTYGATLGYTTQTTIGVNYHINFTYIVPMRAPPTLLWSEWTSSAFAGTAALFQQVGTVGANVYKPSTGTSPNGYFLGGYTASAEL